MSKDTVNFGADPEYLSRIESAKSGAPPVGGAPMPKMPRLDQPPAGDRFSGVQPPAAAKPRDQIIPPEQREALERDGRLIPGVGSAYAANQPAMRNQSEKPGDPEVANPPRAEGGLRPETVRQLDDLGKVVEGRVDEAAEDRVAREVSQEDAIDFGELGQKMRNLLNNKQRREAIEKRIIDVIDIEDLILHQELRQRVPIIPGRFVPTYRTTSGHEDMWVKRMMGGETGSETYIVDRYAMMNLCCGLFSINDKILPTHLDKDGRIEEKLFNAKYAALLRYPLQVLADLSVNYVWFSRRAEKALVVDDIKGF